MKQQNYDSIRGEDLHINGKDLKKNEETKWNNAATIRIIRQ